MRKNLIKLSAAAVLVVIALVVTVATTFAWYVVSRAPEASGMQLNIGGSNTIRIAADTTVVTDEGVLHYPAAFSNTLNFSRVSSYDYLNDIVSLTPVSTANGIHWFFPADEGATGADIVSGYRMDDTYSYANLSELPKDDSVHGSYVMLDFWLMSPMDSSVRVSYGDGDNGTYVVGLPYPQKNSEGNYELDKPTDMLPACVRVGFLADTRTQTDGSLDAYKNSSSHTDEITELKGVYSESGDGWDYVLPNFTIFEPSADVHSGDSVYSQAPYGSVYRQCVDGSYVKTYPIGYVNGQAQPVDLLHRTTVQKAPRWLEEGDGLLIQQLFQTFMLGESQKAEPQTVFSKFCSEYLGYRCDSYMEKGAFVRETDALEQMCGSDGTVSSEDFSTVLTDDVTEDVVIVELQKDVPQRIRMFVWVEGQDVDCSNVIAASGLMINIELAGSSR